MKDIDMESRTRILVAATGFLLLLAAASLYSTGRGSAESLDEVLGSEGYRFEAGSNYSVKSSQQSNVAGIPVREIEAESGESRATVRLFSGIDSGFASSYIQDKREELAAIYTDTPAPYEGVPGRKVDCPERFVPELEGNSTDKEEFDLYSGSDRKIGVCSNATAEYRNRISILYCPDSGKLVSLKISQPVEEKEISSNIACRTDV